MSDFIFKISPNIILGDYTTTRLGQLVQEWGNKFMVILDPILRETGTSDKIIQSLQDRKIGFFTFDEVPTASNSQVIESALTLAREAHVHGIIAAGGGKTINLAKTVCALYNEKGEFYEYLDGKAPQAEPLPLICMPTTMRDSFIFIDKTPVIDARSSKIKLINNQKGICKLSIWDPNLSVSLTQKQVAAMSLQTLCMAVEAYISQKATFFSDMFIEKAVQLLGYAIDGSQTLTVTTPQEVLLFQGGCLTSLGAASSSLGAASLLSMTINSRFKVSRSLTSTILFPYIIEDASKFRMDKLARISRILRAAGEETPDEEAVKMFSEYIRQHIAKANLPARMKDLSLSMEKLSLAAEDAGELDLINTLARSMTTDDLFDLIKQAF